MMLRKHANVLTQAEAEINLKKLKTLGKMTWQLTALLSSRNETRGLSAQQRRLENSL